MSGTITRLRLSRLWAILSFCSLCAGCKCAEKIGNSPDGWPRELAKVSLPPYVIESPDILSIDAIRVIPLPPYHIEPLDVLAIESTKTFPAKPISGLYTVGPDGRVDLGFDYGSVEVDGMTLVEAKEAIRKYLNTIIKEPEVTVALAQAHVKQEIRGPHLVRPDGTVALGTYGSVYVAGMTLDEAKAAMEAHLGKYLRKPQVSLDVYAYNSKVYYVITDGAGFGEQIISIPFKGNETVLDALSQVNGLSPVSSKNRIWLARPAPADKGCCQVLPVDYKAISQGGATATNYQILPGDRVYVKAVPLITIDTWLARIITPIERVLGVTLLGNETVRSFERGGGTGTGTGSRGF
jgi:polysaccharide export outer membrane protein